MNSWQLHFNLCIAHVDKRSKRCSVPLLSVVDQGKAPDRPECVASLVLSNEGACVLSRTFQSSNDSSSTSFVPYSLKNSNLIVAHTPRFTLLQPSLSCLSAAFAKDVPHQAHLGQEATTKPTAASMDSHAHGQHHQMERQAPTLASYQVGIVDY